MMHTPELHEKARQTLKRLNETDHHRFSLLFNAYVEKSFGEKIQLYKDCVSHVYSDSGGLQVVTRGLPINDKIKTDIFNIQGRYSDFCVGFDSIPVVLTAEKSTRLDVKNRYFDRSEFQNSLNKTIEDTKFQLEILKKTNSNCKALLIVHGNDLETYTEWYTKMYNALKNDFGDCLAGIALASAALGTGPLEDLKRAFYFSQIQNIHGLHHFHVLGVGAANRLMPFLIFLRNGMISEESNISYDSTTHTMGIHFGNYQAKNRRYNFGKEMTKDYKAIYDDINEFEPLGITLQEFFECMNPTAYTIDSERLYPVQFYSIMASINNFMNLISKASKDDAFLLKHFSPDESLYKPLLNISNKEDYEKWEYDAARFINSSNVVDYARPTLGDLFE
jgi:hypothetical protein